MKARSAILHQMGAKPPYKQSKPLKVEEIELEGPGEGEVLVEVRASGLCHSDLSVINGNRPRPTPMALGHESAGIVREVGVGVRNLSVGDHVVMVFVPSCGECMPCVDARPALCEPGAVANGKGTLLSGNRRIKLNGEYVNHHIGVSAFSDYVVVSSRSLVRIEKDLPFDIAALFGCAVLTGVGAVINTAKATPGSTVGVIGLGGIGLNSILAADAIGATRIVAIDLLDDKLEFSKSLGATDAYNAATDRLVERVKDETKGGLDFVMETAGSVKALELAYNITKRGGTTVTAGLAHPSHNLSIQQVSLVAEERTLKGSYIGSCVPKRDVPKYIELYKRGKLPVNKLMSGTIGFDQLNEAFDVLDSGHTMRQVLLPHGK
ncbi:MAG: zinc-dependent alcohol dehydrogenase family protein [Oligoflexales bacterium]